MGEISIYEYKQHCLVKKDFINTRLYVKIRNKLEVSIDSIHKKMYQIPKAIVLSLK